MALPIGELTGTIGLETGPFQGALDKLSGLLEESKGKWTGILGGAGLAAATAFGGSLLSALNTDKAVGKVQASLGLTEKASQRVGKVAGSLYSNAYGESMEDVTGAVESVMSSIGGMSNASAKDLERVTGKAMTFAQVMGVDIDRAAQVAGQMVKNGLAKNADEAFDLLTRASQKVPRALRQDVLDATDEYGQFFSAIGIKGPEAMGILAKGAEKGMYGIDKAGDAIKEFTIRSTDMSTASKAGYDLIGMSQEGMTKRLLAGGDTAAQATQQIINGILGIKDPAKQSQAALALFGTPLEDLNTQDIPKFLGSLKAGGKGLDNWRGSTDRAGKALNDNAGANLTKFTRTIKTGLVNALGGWAVPAVTALTGALANSLGPAVRGAGDIIQSVSGFIREHATAAKVVAGIVAGVLAPAFVVLGVQATIAGAKQVAAWAVSAAGAIASRAVQLVSLTLVGLGWAKAGLQAMLGAAKMAAAWLLAMGPIGIAIAAIAAVVILVIKYWDQIKAATSAAWGWISGAIGKAWGAIKGAVSAAGGAVAGVVSGAWNGIKAGTSAAWGGIKGAVGGAWGGIKSASSSSLGAIKGVVGPGFSWLRDKMSGPMQAARTLLSNIWTGIKTIFKGALSIVKSLVAGDFGAVREKIGSAVETARTLVSSAFGRIKTSVSEKLGDVVGFVKGLPARIVSGLGKIGSLLYNAGGDLVRGMINGLKAAAGKLASAAKDMAKNAVGAVKGALGIASPSKVFRRLGMWTGEGMADGLGASTSMVAARAADLARSATREAQAGLDSAAMSNLRAAGSPSMGAAGARGGERVVERVVIERTGPLIGELNQQPGESADQLAERVWALSSSRGY